MNGRGNTGRSVVVTAGARGIGLAIARRFLGGGDRVTVCDVSPEALDLATAENPGLGGFPADVGDSTSVEGFFADVTRNQGPVEVLVNNAGIGGPRAPIESISYDDWDRTIQVNLSGMFYCSRQVVPSMKEVGGGSILNISTGSTRTGLPLRLPYVASKAGVEGLTYNLARELGPFGIRCNALLPGLIDNPRGRALVENHARERGLSFQEAEAEFTRYVSMRTWIDPSEVAEMAFFLASNAARHVSGQCIGVCGNCEWEE